MSSGSSNRRLDSALYVRLDGELRAFVDSAAAAVSTSSASWLRTLAAERRAQLGEHWTPLPRVTARRRPRSRLVAEDVAAVSQLAAHLARLNGAVIQLSKATRLAERQVHHEHIEAVLGELRLAQGQLVELIGRLA
jgi:hypothetical protein